jgi:hypothetical protein
MSTNSESREGVITWMIGRRLYVLMSSGAISYKTSRYLNKAVLKTSGWQK